MDIGTLRLEQMDWVKDLGVLDSIPEDKEISIELAQMDQLKDLSPLARLKAGDEQLTALEWTALNNGSVKPADAGILLLVPFEDGWQIVANMFE